MLTWDPKDDYPGAVICLGCSYGVQVREGSVHEAVSGSGNPGLSGTVRTHHVKYERDPLYENLRATRMAYASPRKANS